MGIIPIYTKEYIVMKKISERLLNDLEKAEKQVLNEEELTLISGGGRCAWIDSGQCFGAPNDDRCIVDYSCFTAIMHSDDGVLACWSDYICVIVNH